MSQLRCALPGLLAAACLLGAGSAGGQPIGDCGAAAPSAERLEVRLPAALHRSALPEAVCDWLGRDGRSIRFQSLDSEAGPSPSATSGDSASRHSATIVLWVRRLDDAVLLILERGSARADLRRSLPPLRQPSVAGIELIAQAIHGMVQMAEEAPVHAPVSPASVTDAPAPTEAGTATSVAEVADAVPLAATGDDPSATERRSLPLAVALGYRGYLRGDEPLAHGLELSLELGVDAGMTRAFGLLRVGLRRSAAQRIESLDLTTGGTAFGAGVGAARRRGAWALTGALEYAIERTVVSVEPGRDDPTLRALPAVGASWRQYLGLELGASWLVGTIELRLQGLARWQLVASPYRILEDGQQRVVAAPWRIQPGAAVGVAYRWGG
jgi:hypothetical protein